MIKHIKQVVSVLLAMTLLITGVLLAAYAEQSPEPTAQTEKLAEASGGNGAEPACDENPEKGEASPAPTEPESQIDEGETTPPAEEPTGKDEATPPEEETTIPTDEESAGDEAPVELPLSVLESPNFIAGYTLLIQEKTPLFETEALDDEPFATADAGVVFMSARGGEHAAYILFAQDTGEEKTEPETLAVRGAWVDAALIRPITQEEESAYLQSAEEAEECYVGGDIRLLAIGVVYSKAAETTLAAEQTIETMTATNVALKSIRLGGASSISKDGGTATLTVTPNPANAQPDTIVWTLSEPAGYEGLVAELSQEGVVTAKGNGKITVTATVEGTAISAKKTISISKQDVTTERVNLYADANILFAGKTLAITPSFTPLTATDKALTWSVAQGADYASVSSSGRVSLKKTMPKDDVVDVTIRASLKSDPSIYGEWSLTACPVPTALRMDQTAVTLYLYQNNQGRLAPTVQRSALLVPDCTNTYDAILWKTSNKRVATVNEDGLVTAVASGTATITAYSKSTPSRKATFRVTVRYPVESLSISGKNGQAHVLLGKSLQLLGTLTPLKPTVKTLRWTLTDNAQAASISTSGGLLKAPKNKTTDALTYPRTVTVQAEALGADPDNGDVGRATYSVTIYRPVSTLSITAPSAIIDLGDEDKTIQLGVSYGAAENEVKKGVTWKTSNARVLTIDQNGLATGIKNGTATVTATATDGSNKSARITIRVATAVRNIQLTGPDEVAKGANVQLTASVTPTGAATKTLAWTTSDAGIATVSSSGRVTGKQVGTATITATAKDGSGVRRTKEITIVPAPEKVTINHALVKATDNRFVISLGTEYPLSAVITPGQAAQAVTWTSSNTKVAKVQINEQSGAAALVPIAIGNTTISATAQNGKRATLSVRVRNELAYAAPINLSVLGGEDGTAKLSWQHGDEENKPTRYAVYQQTAADGWQLLGTTTSLSYTAKVSAEGDYVFSVAAQVKVTSSFYENGERTVSDSVHIVSAPVYRALLVAESDYATGSDLRATPYDVNAMAQVLTHGATKYQVTKRTDLGKSAFISAVRNAFRDAASNDVSLLFFSGHGASTTLASNSYRGALCFVDGTYVTGAELAELLSEVDGKVIVILESCFSGNMIWDGVTLTGTQDAQAAEAEANAVAQAAAAAFGDEMIDAFRAYDEMELQSGELRRPKFYVLTAAAYDQSGLEAGYTYGNGTYAGGFGFLTYCLTKGVGYNFSDSTLRYSWSSGFPADTNGDKVISLSEAYNHARITMPTLYAGLDESKYPVQKVQSYPSGSSQPVFFK